LGALALCVAVPLAAQNPASAPTREVRGVVFDSTARTPLVGAVVHIASRDVLGPPFTATTDSMGRFRIAGLPSGQFLIDFDHDVLRALGLEAPLRAFALAADTLAMVDIGVPSSAVVRALHCGRGAAAAREGMLAGFVRNAGDDSTSTGATVTVAWRAIALDPGNYHTVVQRARTAVGADGTYSLCGLPTDAPLDLRVTAPGHRPIVGHILVPDEGLVRQDVRLADSATMRGAARVRGRVVQESGKPVLTGRAVIAALARDVPVNNGDFLLTDLPPGTWEVEVRSIGLEPRSALVDATEGDIAIATITLDDKTQQLAAVTVIGKVSRDSKVLDEVLRRKSSSFGTTFLPGSIWLQNALHPADVLRAARGFRYVSPTEIYAREQSKGMNSGPCRYIAVYLDGAFFPGGFEALDNAVKVREVLAIEAYPDIGLAPIQWRTEHVIDESQSTVGRARKLPAGPCAVVAVWTKH
jgi:hypothetical protein